MAEVLVNGVTLNYRQTGAGADLVLLHGLAANQAFWNFAVVAALAREFRVTTFDLRGHGYSSMPSTGYRPLDLAVDLGALLDHLGIGPVHLVGHSLGGLVALHYALAQPGRVQSLTCADVRIRSLQPKQDLPEIADWPLVRETLARHHIVLARDEPSYVSLLLYEALTLLEEDKSRPQSGGRSAEISFAGGGTRSAKRWLQLVASTSLETDFRDGADIAPEQLARIRVPVLALYGELSPTRETGEILGRLLADCQTILVTGASHFHPVTHPQFFRDAVRTFVLRISQAGTAGGSG
jgi:pimeloyl-ACP methyl ester carboxylesterase